MQKRTVTALLLAGAATATSAAEYELDPVIVTASRVAETADETLAPVSVVTREDIERTKPQSMVDLLRLQPGIAITRDGGLSGATSIHMRGTESDHVLILIDGVRVSSSTSALFNWRSLSPAQVERMEIVRGPRATLYGSEAIGGVIQIFTRRADGIRGEVEAGSHDTRSGSVGLGVGNDRVRFDLTASHVESDGFNATRPSNFSYHPDDDGFEEQSLNTRLSADLTDRLSVSLGAWYSEGEAYFDQGNTDLENGLLNTRLDWQLTDSWSQSLQLAHTIDEQRTYTATSDGTYDSQRNSYEWQNDLVIAERHILTAGLSRVEDRGESVDMLTGTESFDEEVHTNAAFANLSLDFGDHSVQGGLRHDDHSEFGGHTTGQLAWGWAFAPEWRALASYGTAFKAPTLNDLYYPGFFGMYAGNPDLDPERSESAEVGLRYTPIPTQRWELNLFRTNIDDLIALAPDFSQYENVDQATIRGMEIVHGGELGRWHWQFNLTLQKARNADTDARLIGRPDEQLSVVLGRQIGRGQIQADWLLAGDRVSFNGNELSSYSLLNLSASYPIWKGLSVTARIENVTDEEYQLIDTYNTSERAYFVGLRYQPE